VEFSAVQVKAAILLYQLARCLWLLDSDTNELGGSSENQADCQEPAGPDCWNHCRLPRNGGAEFHCPCAFNGPGSTRAQDVYCPSQDGIKDELCQPALRRLGIQ
jgi:hypothetical protein